MSKINLEGGEITIIRALGLSGVPMSGKDLKSRVGNTGDTQLTETLKTMIALGYVSATPDLDMVEDLDKVTFAVNSGYSRALKEALEPEKKGPPKRVRRQ
jgi:hypothetical protein